MARNTGIYVRRAERKITRNLHYNCDVTAYRKALSDSFCAKLAGGGELAPGGNVGPHALADQAGSVCGQRCLSLESWRMQMHQKASM